MPEDLQASVEYLCFETSTESFRNWTNAFDRDCTSPNTYIFPKLCRIDISQLDDDPIVDEDKIFDFLKSIVQPKSGEIGLPPVGIYVGVSDDHDDPASFRNTFKVVADDYQRCLDV